MEGKIEERRIQRLGTSSLIMTLPKKWVKSVGLKQGDFVKIIVKNNYLVIFPSKMTSSLSELSLKITKKINEYIASNIPKCLYELGVQRALLISENVEPRIINKIISSIHSLPGAKPTLKEENIQIDFKLIGDIGQVPSLLESQIENLILVLKSVAETLQKGVNEELVHDAQSLLHEVERTHYEITRTIMSQINISMQNKSLKHLQESSHCILELTRLSTRTISTLHSKKIGLPKKQSSIIINKLIYILKNIGDYIEGNKEINEVKEEFKKIENEIFSRKILQAEPYIFAKTEDFIVLIESLINKLSCWETSKAIASMLIQAPMS